ncbi:hypothetical protein PAJ34TS1_15940 [Paenibacillus azoreducens]
MWPIHQKLWNNEETLIEGSLSRKGDSFVFFVVRYTGSPETEVKKYLHKSAIKYT